MRFGTFLSTVIRFQVILEPVRASDLPKQDIPEGQLFWNMRNACDDRLPIVNKGAQVVIDQADLEEIFN